jgi:hypothetical protein
LQDTIFFAYVIQQNVHDISNIVLLGRGSAKL